MSVVEQERVIEKVAPDEARDVLRDAKGVIAAGWHQLGVGGRMVGVSPLRCVVSAVFLAADARCPDNYDAASELGRRAVALLKAEIGREWRSVPQWNDSPERTHAEVVALFDKALLAA